MKNIHVRRFSASNDLQGLIEPEDGAWLVLIGADGQATFWRQMPDEAIVPEGVERALYIDAELPGSGKLLQLEPIVVEGTPAEPPPTRDPLDFTITPAGPDGDPGYFAMLNARAVSCFGSTEHEAIRGLLNYAVQLAVAGCLDHTGRPMPGHCKRRYDAVFPPSEEHVEASAVPTEQTASKSNLS